MLTYEERHYAAKGFFATINSKRTNKKSIGRAALKGGAIGLAGGVALGIAAKGISNRRKGEKFFKGTGKAALVGGSVGAVAGAGIGAGLDVRKQGKSQADALTKAKALRLQTNKENKDFKTRRENPFVVSRKGVDAPTKKTEPEPKNSTTPHDPFAKSRDLRGKAKVRMEAKSEYDKKANEFNANRKKGFLGIGGEKAVQTSSEITRERKLRGGHVPTNRGDDKAKESDTKGNFKGGLAGGLAGNIVNAAGKSRARVKSRMSNLSKGAAAGAGAGGLVRYAAGAGEGGKSKSKAPEVNFSYYGNGN